MVRVLMLLSLTMLMLGCEAPSARTAAPTFAAAGALPTATATPPPMLAAPTASASERQTVNNTWLYLTAFQSGNVSVIDPLNGHVLREFSVVGDQAGMAVAPDGSRLYILDGQQGGELRVYRTGMWDVIHREPIQHYAHLLGGNPITLSGDGRWLVVAHLNVDTRQGWNSVFDTQQMVFLPDDALPLRACREAWLPVHLLGQANQPRVYADCNGFIQVLDAATLKPLWQVNAPTAINPALALSPDGTRLYGVYPRVNDLRLQVWQTSDGTLLKEQLLGDRLSIPPATFGRGEGVYLALVPDGTQFYLAWEDRLWALATNSLRPLGELQLPAPADGLAISGDGRELYLLPATAGDLTTRERGLWTVDASTLKLIRHAPDWPAYTVPFFFAAPGVK